MSAFNQQEQTVGVQVNDGWTPERINRLVDSLNQYRQDWLAQQQVLLKCLVYLRDGEGDEYELIAAIEDMDVE